MTMRRTILIGAGVLGLACSQFAWATSTEAQALAKVAKVASADSSSDSGALKKTASPKEADNGANDLAGATVPTVRFRPVDHADPQSGV